MASLHSDMSRSAQDPVQPHAPSHILWWGITPLLPAPNDAGNRMREWDQNGDGEGDEWGGGGKSRAKGQLGGETWRGLHGPIHRRLGEEGRPGVEISSIKVA